MRRVARYSSDVEVDETVFLGHGSNQIEEMRLHLAAPCGVVENLTVRVVSNMPLMEAGTLTSTEVHQVGDATVINGLTFTAALADVPASRVYAHGADEGESMTNLAAKINAAGIGVPNVTAVVVGGVITLTAAAGFTFAAEGHIRLAVDSVYNVVLFTQAMNTVQDVHWQPARPYVLGRGDRLRVVWPNGGSEVYGLEFVWSGTGV
jgi:hypothetical protein